MCLQNWIKQKNNKRKAIGFFVFFFLCLIVLSIFGGHNYSSDGYVIDAAYSQTGNLNENAIWYIRSFRFTSALIAFLFGFVKHNPISNSTVDVLILCVILAGCITALVENSIKDNNQPLHYCIVAAGVLLSFFNVGYCNVLSFPECIVLMAAGTLLVTLSILVATSKQSVLRFILSTVFLVLATGCFQQLLSFFFIFTVIITLADGISHQEASKKTLKRLLYVVCIFIVSGILYYLIAATLVKVLALVGNERAELDPISILGKILYFIRYGHSFIINIQFFRTYIHLFLSFILGIVALVGIIKQKAKFSLKILIVVVVLTAYLSAFLPSVLSSSTNVRATMAVSSLYFIFALLICTLDLGKTWRLISLFALCVALLCNITKIGECELNLKRTNALDKAYSEAILEQIYQYEAESGYTVVEVSFCQDSDCPNKYYDYTYTNRAFTISWSSDQILNVYKDANHVPFHVSIMQDEYAQFFAGKNWDRINLDEQIIFVQDHAYICIP